MDDITELCYVNCFFYVDYFFIFFYVDFIFFIFFGAYTHMDDITELGT